MDFVPMRTFGEGSPVPVHFRFAPVGSIIHHFPVISDRQADPLAFQALPQQLRDIVVLRYYDGKPLTEIAEMMGLSYGAVKLRHQNALLLLREKMLK
jgi:hypothetical protein